MDSDNAERTGFAAAVEQAPAGVLRTDTSGRIDFDQCEAGTAQRRLDAIVENSQDAILASTPAGVILTWNRGAQTIFGYAAGEAVGRHVSMLMAPGQLADMAYFTGQVSQGIAVSQYEILCMRKDGGKIQISVTGAPILDSAGQVVALSAVLRDISERTAAESVGALLASIVEFSDDAILSTSLDGSILGWSQGAATLLGYSIQEIAGKSVGILAPPGNCDVLRQHRAALAKGCVVRPFDTILQARDGRGIEVSLSLSPIRNKDGAVVGATGIARDIRERLSATRKLRESEILFRRGFEHAPYGICVTGMDGRYIQVNRVICRMLGYSKEEVLNTPWAALVHPDELAASLEKMDQLLKDPDGLVESERRYIHRNGSVLLLRVRASLIRDDAGRPQFCVAHVQDITESKRADEAAHESEERFRVMADGCPAVMWVTNVKGEIDFINRAFREFLSVTFEQVEGRKWQLTLHPEDAPEYVGALLKAVSEHASFTAEVRVRRADGEWRWMASHAEPRLSADGEFLGHVGISPDITESKRAQEVLHESEERFRVMADCCPAMMWVNDAEGKTQFMNRAHREFNGVQSEGKWQTTLHPDDAPAYLEKVQRSLREHSAVHGDARFKRIDGQWRWLASHAKPRFSSAGEFLGHVGLSNDITDAKNAEEEVRKSQDRYRMLAHAVESSGECISITDIDDRILYVNAALRRTYGYAEHELEGQHIEILRADRTPLEIQHEILPATLAGSWSGELWNRRKDGLEFPIALSTSVVVDETGRRTALVGFARDISQRRKADQELQSSEEKFRQLAENIREVFFVIDPAANTTIYVSPAYEQIWGRSCESLLRNPMAWQEAVLPEDLEAVRQLTARQMTGEAVASEFRIRTPEGEVKWIRNRTFPVRDAAGELVRLVGIAEEINERKRYEAELIHARDGADAANRAKSCFLANMSHEIRTPMNGVIGMLQLLNETEMSQEQRRYASVAQDSGQILLKLIDDILDLSRIEARKITLENLNFNPRDTLENLVQMMRVQASEKDLVIQLHVSPEIPPWLRGDAHRLRQVITNLLANAIKFTERGEVGLSAKIEERRERTTMVRFTVTDTGIGIHPDKIEKIFLPFSQADSSTTRKSGGTGLGLAISRQLVEMMDGTMDVESREGRGSLFSFTAVFDRVTEYEGRLAPPDLSLRVSGTTNPRNRTATILVAEDNGTNRFVALAQLKKLGYTAIAVPNGAEAVEAVKRGGIDMVLMDCHMPVMDGFEATRQIRKSAYPDIPIIAVTADAMPDDRIRCLTEGMNDHIGKPVELGPLDAVLAKWLDGKKISGQCQLVKT